MTLTEIMNAVTRNAQKAEALQDESAEKIALLAKALADEQARYAELGKSKRVAASVVTKLQAVIEAVAVEEQEVK
jgi:hypothetical protein